MPRNKNTGASALRLFGLGVCVIPPILAILAYFPVWRHGDADKIISGGALILIIIAHAPLIRWMKSKLSSVAGYTVWLVIFVFFAILSSIAYEMKVISLVGFISNVLGALILNYSEKAEDIDGE